MGFISYNSDAKSQHSSCPSKQPMNMSIICKSFYFEVPLKDLYLFHSLEGTAGVDRPSG